MDASHGLDTSTVHSARRYNYWLGGKDNFAVDRESGDLIAQAYPHIAEAARQNRAFLQRAVRYLTAEAGMRQFLDIGTGLPTADNTHEVAQRIAPETRVVYVDNDPMVMTHARALLTSSPEGRTRYIEADLRDPARILADPDLRDTLDLGRPLALMVVAVVHFLPDREQVRGIIRTLVDALPSGSYLTMTSATQDFVSPQIKAAWDNLLQSGGSDVWPRPAERFLEFFEGLELIDPGLSAVGDWRPDPGSTRPAPEQASMYGLVARKP